MPRAPLEGVRILDLTQRLAGPFATMLAGDMGAEVIKIEPPAGDSTRQTPPHFLNGDSGYFLSVNRNKRSVVLDLKVTAGREVFRELVGCSDVVLDNFRPGVMERLGIDHQSLAPYNPALVTCSLTAFGKAGPYRELPGFDLIVQAMSGLMSITGEVGGPPLRSGIATGDLMGGLFALVGVLSGLVERSITGTGVHVDASLLGGQMACLSYLVTYFFMSGRDPQPVGTGHPSSVVFRAFRTSDGWLAVDAHDEKFYPLFCQAVGRPDLAQDQRFAARRARLSNRDELYRQLDPLFAQQTTQAWASRLQAQGVPCGPVNTVGSALSSDQVSAMGLVEEIQHPAGGSYKAVGSPLDFSGWSGRYRCAPRLGADTAEVLGRLLGYNHDRITELERLRAICVDRGQ